MNKTIWTVGHSNRTWEDFIDILRSFNIEQIVDVRSFPGSRRFPHFNKKNFETNLPKENISYIHINELGGRRKVNPDSLNIRWEHSAFRGYADYMETEEFKEAIQKLTELASEKRTAFMCTEAVWWKCHRSLISDYLKSIGWQVINILAEDKTEEHPYTSAAQTINGELSYKGLV